MRHNPLAMIDTHCHLNDPEAFPDVNLAVQEAVSAGVGRMIVIGINESSCELALELAEAHPELFAVIGWHPNYAHEYKAAHLKKLREWSEHPKCVAIGETGADFHWDFATWDEQEAAFRDQLDLARELDKPVVLHCREASEAMLGVLEQNPPRNMVWHCFGGNEKDFERFNALGGYFGIDGPVTYSKSTELRSLLQKMPQDRLLLETDSPYLAPLPHRGKRNSPAYLPLILATCAKELGLRPDVLEAITDANAERFFRLD